MSCKGGIEMRYVIALLLFAIAMLCFNHLVILYLVATRGQVLLIEESYPFLYGEMFLYTVAIGFSIVGIVSALIGGKR